MGFVSVLICGFLGWFVVKGGQGLGVESVVPLVALSTVDYFVCPGVNCPNVQPAVDDGPTMMRDLLRFMTTGNVSEEISPQLAHQVQPRDAQHSALVEVVIALVVEKVSLTASELASLFESSLVQTTGAGSSYVGSYRADPTGTNVISILSLEPQIPDAKVVDSATLQEMISSNDISLSDNKSQVFLVQAAGSLDGYPETIRLFKEKTQGKVALVVTAKEFVPAQLPLNGMAPLELPPGGLMGLLCLALFLFIFIPGFMCLWNIEAPQVFEVADRESSKRKNQ
mmetsp:Transcript_10593/g.21342  ORF Transcript_10593/g.21342 Transcript_10593/m.21342 type:complete len:283 (-) Transcript_10593:1930-2778(-)